MAKQMDFLLFRFVCLILLLLVFMPTAARAMDRVVTNSVLNDKDGREDYPHLLLKASLEITRGTDGGFEIVDYGPALQRKRALLELERGAIDVYSAATQPSWEARVLPIFIPLRKGILGYRLFLIDRANQQLFSDLQSLEDLKKLSLGSGSQWSITRVFRAQGFKVIGVVQYEQLFELLMRGRFQGFPRGMNEIFLEFDARHKTYPNMTIEEDVALYIPLPTYFFVTPSKPMLKERIETGLRMMMENGEFDRLFYQYHRKSLEWARLGERRIFRMENKSLGPENPLSQPDLWYRPEGLAQ